MADKLSIMEHGELRKLEAAFQKSFTEAGDVLRVIKDKKLYRQHFETFEDYMEKRWGLTRQRGYQMINATVVVEQLPKHLSTIVDTEGAARAVAKIPEENRVKVLEEVKKSGKPVTAKSIKEAHENTNSIPARVAAPTRADNTKAPEVLDQTGYPIPPAIQPFWLRREEVQELLGMLSEIKCEVEQSLDNKDKLYIELHNTILADIQNVRYQLQTAMPHAVCPYCQGQLIDKCTFCKGRGMVSETLYGAADSELKKLRTMGAKK